MYESHFLANISGKFQLPLYPFTSPFNMKLYTKCAVSFKSILCISKKIWRVEKCTTFRIIVENLSHQRFKWSIHTLYRLQIAKAVPEYLFSHSGANLTNTIHVFMSIKSIYNKYTCSSSKCMHYMVNRKKTIHIDF